MKRILTFTMFAIAIACFSTTRISAQTSKGDTLVITSEEAFETPLNEIIAADTNADGSQIHKVYELEPDGWYAMSATLDASTFDLNIYGGKRSEGQMRPIILFREEVEGWQMINALQDLTLNGIWIMQIAETEGGAIGPWARAGISLGSENQTVEIHDVVWDFNTASGLYNAKDGLNMNVSNVLMRFSGDPSNSWWNGFGIVTESIELDTVIIENSTFYQGNFFWFNFFGTSQNLLKIDHCTFVDHTHFPIHGSSYNNAEFTNNIFVNAFTNGEDEAARSGQDPDGLPYGIISIDTIHTVVDTVTGERAWDPDMEAERNFLVANNNNYVNPDIKEYWDWAMNYDSSSDSAYWDFKVADPEYYDGFMNSRVKAMFEDDDTWPGLVHENTTSVNPGFVDYPDLSAELIQHSKHFYGPEGEPKAQIFFDPDGEPLIPTDPMVYNLKYTNETLLTASTTGGPIGDLTWFLDDGYNSPNVTTEPIVSSVEEWVRFPKIIVYPNPVSGNLLKIKGAENMEKTVIDITGKIILSTKKNQIDLTEYSSGVYFIKIGESMHKIIRE